MSSSNEGMNHNRNSERRAVRKIVGITLAALILLIITGGLFAFFYIQSALQPVDSNDDTPITIEIPIGSNVSAIASILEENEIINNDRVFRYYIKFKNESDFQAGEYTFTKAMTLDDIIESLKSGKVAKEPVYTVTIPEGKTIDQIAGIYSKKTNVTKKDFLETVNDPAYIESLIDQYPNLLSEDILDAEIRTPLEGYLFAATYDFYEEDLKAEQIVEKMLNKSNQIVQPKHKEIEKKDLTIHEAVTLASLIEKEAPKEEDRKKISGVFYNRLDQAMPLQTDPTVLYALGKHKDRVLYKDLEVESPYNTYKVKGLPVGPISNFGENALDAVIDPEPSEYLYFVAAPNGEIYYSNNYEEHQKLVEEHLR
ncbi:endolytic transglycosylase MltG [Pontibacillus litoralis]|uniref:Endolytic murein transglycosylase n=1 Tax=Pontibacillus litoralis JSM 072002 TaxID=1385512 RepID=A0A0A5GCW7_9BACI|nr:endolytic transglycosylase MltG [Pontibacillus litoralis]KGX88965.1 hypothetical protein N784_01110 [Pontibacillus litoralis JSM 072002]